MKVPPTFGMSNRSMFTVPLGPVVPGLKALRGRTAAAVKAQSQQMQVKAGASPYPNGKRQPNIGVRKSK